MKGFTPFKKSANRFNYIPRYYDPAKEARDNRRAELKGERSEDVNREYRPGQYIRTQRDARSARRGKDSSSSTNRIFVMGGVAVIVLLFVYILYPRVVGVFKTAATTPTRVETVIEEDAFNPYTPITIVPNDYQEE